MSPAAPFTPLLPHTPAAAPFPQALLEAAKEPAGMETWQAALLGLDADNPLLCLAKESAIDVGVPHAFSEIFKLLIHRAKPIGLWNSRLPDFDKSLLSQAGNYAARPAALDKLRHAKAQADALLQSQDVNVLFVGFGTLSWQNSRGQTLRSPLLLVPATLSAAPNEAGYLVERMEQEVEVNPLLRHYLALEDKAHVLPAMPEEAYLIPSAYLAEIGEKIKEQDGWSVEECCFLCRLPLLKMRLYEDIVQQEARAHSHPLVRALLGGGTELPAAPASDSSSDAMPAPLEFQLLDADPAQEAALQAAFRGESFVLHGPPGTGKTQTITNIIGQCIALGKSVLLVSGRVASLQAVQMRLAQRGLGHHCLSAHSMTTSKRDILQQLGHALKPQTGGALACCKRRPAGENARCRAQTAGTTALRFG